MNGERLKIHPRNTPLRAKRMNAIMPPRSPQTGRAIHSRKTGSAAMFFASWSLKSQVDWEQLKARPFSAAP